MKGILMFCDTETTGFSPKNHAAFNIACIFVVDGVVSVKLDLFLKPHRFDDIQQKALDCNGWTVEELEKLTDGKLAVDCLIHAMTSANENREDTIPLIRFVEWSQNGAFDCNFVFEELRRYYPDEEFSDYFSGKLNAKWIFNKKFPGIDPLHLGDACRRLGIPYDEKLAHSAMYDAERLQLVWEKGGLG